MTNNQMSPEERCRALFAACGIPVTSKVGSYEEFMLRDEEGVGLRTQIWLPEEPSPAPCIVVRSCYAGQEAMMIVRAEEYCRRGFGFVLQWCRGTNGSEGVWEPNVNERRDGLRLMQFLQEDERFGALGYWGDSYLALTGWAMADAVPDKVKTMFLGVYGCDRHTSAYKDGLFRQDILTSWAMQNAGHPVDADYMTSAAYRPQINVDEAMWGGRLDWYRSWISSPDRSDPYWKQGFWDQLYNIPGKVKFPVFIREGWYDHHLGSALATFDLLSEEAKKHSVLQIGPWNHGYQPVIAHQDITRLEDDSVRTPIQWFDRILRRDELPEGEVRLYQIGEDRWLNSPWPLPETKTCTYYLSGTTLSETPATGETVRTYTYDPENPVLSHGAESLLKSWDEIGSLKQPEPGWRKDVLTWMSDPLKNDLQVCGPIEVHLCVSSDAEDTSFTAKLMEVFEDGTAVNMRGTITTLAYRNNADSRLTYTPGENTEITLRMWPLAWTLKKGSRLRLDVSSSDFPQYAVHSNYPGVWSTQEHTKKAEESVYASPAEPSRIILPLL